MKSGELSALVATASLELGIDIGDVNLVCQLGSTRSIASFPAACRSLESHGRGFSERRIFPLSRDELVSVRRSWIQFDVASSIVWRYRKNRSTFWRSRLSLRSLLKSGAKTISSGRFVALILIAISNASSLTRSCACWLRVSAPSEADGLHLHHDAVNQRIRGRRGARLAAITSGARFPTQADYAVVLEPSDLVIGSVNEDFAIESLQGDIFQLGNTSWRVLRVEQGKVRVEDAHGQPPSIPFWLGEAPARTSCPSRYRGYERSRNAD